jgi:hypothetical protein
VHGLRRIDHVRLERLPRMSYTATGTAFDDIPVDGHRETWPISNRFRNWLRRLQRQKNANWNDSRFFKE